MQAVLEKLYNDLNTKSETSISIDRFNSIELKIFPFYPNPPTVHDWMVPIALIDLTEKVEANWDLTVAAVSGSQLIGDLRNLFFAIIDLSIH